MGDCAKYHLVSTHFGSLARLATATITMILLTIAAPAHAQTFTVLYSFTNSSGDGAQPAAPLIMDSSGNLYGTTRAGGTYADGTVFELSSSGSPTRSYSFQGLPLDGATPVAGLLMDSSGNLYGTTAFGGTYANGTIFKLDTANNESVLNSFGSLTPDGANPVAGLIADASGNLYGTTQSGTSVLGTVFKLDTSGTLTLLHSFAGSPDGATPLAGLVMDSAGNLYGTTVSGGASNNGTVFKISSSGNESVLYSFRGSSKGDGAGPNGGLILDSKGNLYGTTENGGSSAQYGTVFKVSRSGHESVLYRFTGGTDGVNPIGSLVMDAHGNLYGTTASGGASGLGTVFKLTKMGKETILHNFAGGTTDGNSPLAGLLMDSSGALYGTTAGGGANGWGVVFKLVP